MAIEKKFLPSLKVYAPDDLSKKWFVYWYEGKKRIRKYGDINSFSTKEERQAALQRLLDSLNPREVIPQEEEDLKSRLLKILDKKKHLWRKKTYQSNRTRLLIFLDWFGDKSIIKEQVEEFFYHLSTTRNPTTHNDYRTHIGAFQKEAGEGQLIKGIKKLRSNPIPARYFQKHHIRRIKRVVQKRDPELWLAIQFIYYSFIRPGELRHLKAGDIMLDDRRICIRAEISKNRKQQYVSIPDEFYEHLLFVTDMDPRSYLFPSSTDISKPISINVFSTHHRKF